MMLKGKAVTDMTLVSKAIENTDKAFKKFTTDFSCEAQGSIWGNKHGDVVASSVRVLTRSIDAVRTKNKVLKTINVRISIHDSTTMIDYNKVLPVIDKIAEALRKTYKCHVNFMSNHVKCNEIKFSFEGSIVEGNF